MGIPAHDAIDIFPDQRIVVLHIIVEHGDDHLGLAGLLDLRGQFVDPGDRVVEDEPRGRSRTQLVGDILGDGADEGDFDARGRGPHLVVTEVGL
ncbi:Uncharacterised protein [Chlamydia trachomatis]|nr:Uncharacterised protein [Chlamydia trachomatis]